MIATIDAIAEKRVQRSPQSQDRNISISAILAIAAIKFPKWPLLERTYKLYWSLNFGFCSDCLSGFFFRPLLVQDFGFWISFAVTWLFFSLSCFFARIVFVFFLLCIIFLAFSPSLITFLMVGSCLIYFLCPRILRIPPNGTLAQIWWTT